MSSHISFTNELKNTLNYLIINPRRRQIFPREIPRPFMEDIKRFERIERNQSFHLSDDDFFDFSDYFEYQDDFDYFYQKCIWAGVERLEDLRLLLLYYYLHHIGWIDTPESRKIRDLDDELIKLFDCANEGVSGIDKQEYELLEYAQHNYLCYYTDGQWVISTLGRIFLRLPELQASRFILTIETYVNIDDDDPWRISLKTLQEIITEGQFSYSLDGKHFKFAPWKQAQRLVDMHLAEIVGNITTIKLNKLGRQMLDSVLAQDSYFDILLPIYMREEIIGSEPPNFSVPDDKARFHQLIEKSFIVGELKEPILREVDLLYQVEASYLSIFKALAPNIEGLLRNILIKEAIEVKESGVNAYLRTLKHYRQQVLKVSTLEQIDSIFRPYRNIVEHGYFIPPEPARMMCELTLSIIEQILRDYMDYKGRS